MICFEGTTVKTNYDANTDNITQLYQMGKHDARVNRNEHVDRMIYSILRVLLTKLMNFELVRHSFPFYVLVSYS